MSENYWEKFVDQLLERVGRCLDKGEASRLFVAGDHEVTIDIYAAKPQQKAFDKITWGFVARELGIEVVPKKDAR